MKKVIPTIIIGISCCTVLGLAYWSGTVYWYDDGHVGRFCDVWAVGPGDPETETGSLGQYQLDETCGMVPNGYYTFIRAEKYRNDTLLRGELEVNDYYIQGKNKTGLDITIYPPEYWPWK
jgi:hypothetical protein